MMRRAVFVDRDGVINRKMPEGDYVKEVGEFSFLPGALDGLKAFKDAGFLIAVVTNQRCVARGIISVSRLKEIHAMMSAEAARRGAAIDSVYFCPHDVAEDCPCRKPRPGMIMKAIADFEKKGLTVNLSQSFMIGDEEKDMVAGRAAGLKTVKIGRMFPGADRVAESLKDAAAWILDRSSDYTGT